MDPAAKRELREAHLRELGARVRDLRHAAGMTQERLAEQADLHRAAVGHIERGEREMGVAKVWELASALGVRPSDLFRD